jgi:hypothetical protein
MVTFDTPRYIYIYLHFRLQKAIPSDMYLCFNFISERARAKDTDQSVHEVVEQGHVETGPGILLPMCIANASCAICVW